jgi:hypothetical protein
MRKLEADSIMELVEEQMAVNGAPRRTSPLRVIYTGPPIIDGSPRPVVAESSTNA